MKTSFENFTAMSSEELRETNGGGFAFDVGRVLRFLRIGLPGDAISLANAISDWQANTIFNNAQI